MSINIKKHCTHQNTLKNIKKCRKNIKNVIKRRKNVKKHQKIENTKPKKKHQKHQKKHRKNKTTRMTKSFIEMKAAKTHNKGHTKDVLYKTFYDRKKIVPS